MKGLLKFASMGLLSVAIPAFLVSAQVSSPVLNQDNSYNYQELNNIDPNVATLTTDLLGDTIDPASGSLRFSQTDISLPGNFALPVDVTRTLSDPSGWHRENLLFGNWGLDIPHIRSTFVTRGNVGDVQNAYWPTGQACSRPLDSNPSFGESVQVGGEIGVANFVFFRYSINSNDYWSGDSVYIPNKGSATFLDKDPGDPGYIASKPNKRFNNQNWDVDCWDVPGSSHEGFKVTTGDGTQYFFGQQLIRTNLDKLYMRIPPRIPCDSRFNPCISSLNPTDGPSRLEVTSHQMFMLISKVVDKYGNEVDYTYAQGDGAVSYSELTSDDPRRGDVRLTKISASDGRTITLTYNGDGAISSATANGRTWNYRYNQGEALIGVDLPNGQNWAFDSGTSSYGFWRERFAPALLYGDDCVNIALGPSVTNDFITITHPYGAKGTFRVAGQCFGQYDVPEVDNYNPSGLASRESHWIKRENRNVVIKSKTLTFTDDTPAYTWSYDYSFNKGLFIGQTVTNCETPAQPLSQCHTVNYNNQYRADLKTTTITQPDGDYRIHYFDRTYGVDRDNELAMESYGDDDTLLNRTTYDYDLSEVYGDNMTRLGAQTPGSSPHTGAGLQTSYRDQVLVRNKRQTTELFDDTSSSIGAYTQETLAFDQYNQPTKVKGNSPSNTRYIRYEYEAKTAAGVFNLPKRTLISTTDSDYTEVNKTTYKNLSAIIPVRVPNQIYGYGQLKQQFVTYHTAAGVIGQPKKVEYNAARAVGDGKRYLEYLDYYRGIPREVRMPQRLSASATQSAKRTVDSNGWVTSFTDLNGNKTNYGYDKVGRFTYVDQPGSWLDTIYSWTAQSSTQGPRRREQQCALNSTRTACSGTVAYTNTLQFDNLLRPVLTTSTASGTSRYQNQRFDSYNQVLFSSFWSASTTESGGTTSTYDALQRLRTQTTTGLGTNSIAYLSNTKMITTDAKGNQTTTTYRAYGQPSYEQPTLIESPENVNTSLSVDVFGRVTQITQSGGADSQTEYRAYNSFKQLCQVKRSDVGITGYKLNALGQPTEMASGITNSSNTVCLNTLPSNLKITSAYDNLGDIRTMNYPDSSPDLTYSYDKQGNLTGLQAGDVVQTYTYNSVHLLESETLALDGKAFLLDYGYNTQTNLQSLTYPNGDTVQFAPNGYGEPTQAIRTLSGITQATYAQNATYYPTGNINTFKYGNGISHKTTLNSAKLPSRIKDNSTNTVALDYAYQYDNNANITKLTDNQDARFSLTNLVYDGLDRLTSVTAGSGIGNSTINYDALGNITQYNTGHVSLDYTYNSNILTHVDKTDSPTVDKFYEFSYDARGNVTGNGFRGFTFNLANQLSGSGGNTYVYDGFNRRVKQTDSKGTSYSQYSQSGQLVYRETEDGGINYIYLGSRLVAKDGVIKQDAGNQHYYPYGKSVEGEIDDAGYAGHKFDTDLGLSYMQARYYDPVIGRFYSNDPVGFIGHAQSGNPIHGFNRYTYANNNPYKYTDPDGKIAFLAWLATPPGIAALQYTGTALVGILGGVAIAEAIDDAGGPTNLADGDATNHILNGDEDGGGHGPGRGIPGKSEFPSDMSDEDVMDAISDVATDPDSKSRPAREGRTKTSGTRNEVKIDVITGNADENGKIITAWPNNVPRNPEKE